MSSAFQLILLPGLGADHRLFEPQRRAFPQLIVPPWIPPRRKESLPGYAARMAKTVAPSRNAPLLLGGVSFGGMLAYEMARHLKPEAVVLIASCRTRRGLRPIYRVGGKFLPLLPAAAWSVPKLLAAPAMRLRGLSQFSRHGEGCVADPRFCRENGTVPLGADVLVVEMFKEMDSRFMHWVLRALLGWRPTPLEGISVRQIHGRRDLLIPARRVEADEYIPGGGHMINVTHAKEVNAFLREARGSRR